MRLKPVDLIGKKIVGVAPMDNETLKVLGWYKRPFVIQLDDGSILIPQTDDEGNDGGAVAWYTIDSETILYTQ